MTQQLRRLIAASMTTGAAVLAFGPLTALAQQPLEGPAPNTCDKPAEFAPLDRASPNMQKFNKRVADYKDCINAYAKANGAKASEISAVAKSYLDAANKAIEDYNQYVGTVNANNEKANTDAAAAKK